MVCSDANVVAVVDVSEDRSHVQGFIPTGWYPTAARVLPNGTLVVLNGRGGGSHPNPHGPNPTRRPEASHVGGVRGRIRGPHPNRHGIVYRSLHRRASSRPTPRPRWPTLPIATRSSNTANPFPPIEHVIYIVKENRTYDQVLGRH